MLGKLSLAVLTEWLRASASLLSFLEHAVWPRGGQTSMRCRELERVERRGRLKRCQSRLGRTEQPRACSKHAASMIVSQ